MNERHDTHKKGITWRRALVIWATYAFAGPLFGACTGWLEFSLLGILQSVGIIGTPTFPRAGAVFNLLETIAVSIPGLLPFALFFGYIWGILFSSLAGIIIVVTKIKIKKLSLLHALNAASLSYIIIFSFTYIYYYVDVGLVDGKIPKFGTFSPLILVNHPEWAILPSLFASAVCWRLTRFSINDN